MELGEPEKKKKRQESEDERRACNGNHFLRASKRSERANTLLCTLIDILSIYVHTYNIDSP